MLLCWNNRKKDRQKEDRHDKSIYRPVSILPLSSKPFECNLYEQMESYTKKYGQNIRENFEQM